MNFCVSAHGIVSEYMITLPPNITIVTYSNIGEPITNKSSMSTNYVSKYNHLFPQMYFQYTLKENSAYFAAGVYELDTGMHRCVYNNLHLAHKFSVIKPQEYLSDIINILCARYSKFELHILACLTIKSNSAINYNNIIRYAGFDVHKYMSYESISKNKYFRLVPKVNKPDIYMKYIHDIGYSPKTKIFHISRIAAFVECDITYDILKL